jgi:hypothetical protein
LSDSFAEVHFGQNARVERDCLLPTIFSRKRRDIGKMAADESPLRICAARRVARHSL